MPDGPARTESAVASLERGSTVELWAWPALLIATYYPIYYLIDVYVTRPRPPEQFWDLMWPAIDGAIPFAPAWQLAYVLVYLAALLPVFVVRDPLLMRRGAFVYLFSMAASFTSFIVLPVSCDPIRARDVVVDDFFTWIARLHYEWDAVGNCFPSLHVAIALNSAFVVGYASRNVGAFAVVAAGLIAASTVFVKQHFFIDAVAGLALGLLGERIFIRGYRPPPPEAGSPLRGWRAFALYAAVYPAVLGILYAVYRSGFRPWEG